MSLTAFYCMLAVSFTTAAIQSGSPVSRCSVLMSDSAISCTLLTASDILDSSTIFVSNASEIEKLYLSYNNISKIDSRTFLNFTKLRRLHLNNNRIVKLPGNVFYRQTELIELDLSNNQLSDFNEHHRHVFWPLHNLETLNLSGNQFTHILPQIFPSQNNILYLLIDKNKITSLSLIGLTKLSELSLQSNSLTNLDKNMFNNTPSLEVLKLNRNHISQLPKGTFSELKNLKHLSLKSNILSKLEDGLLDGLQKLKILELQSNLLSELPRKAFFRMNALESLYLNNNNITYLEVDVFSTLKELQVLELQNNLLQSIERRMLEPLVNLKKLKLSGNPLICNCTLKDSWLWWHQRHIETGALCFLPAEKVLFNFDNMLCGEGNISVTGFTKDDQKHHNGDHGLIVLSVVLLISLISMICTFVIYVIIRRRSANSSRSLLE